MIAVEPRLTLSEWARMMREPLRDESYQLTRLGGSVRDFLAWKQLRAAERTLDQYERDLARGCIAYPDVPLEEWTLDLLTHVLVSFPPASRGRARAAYRELFRWAIITGKRESDPTVALELPKQAQRYVETFTLAEQDALVELDLHDGALMMVLVDAGLRKAEARNLTKRRAKPETGQIVVLKGKGQKDRVVPMTRRLKAKLNDLYRLDGLDDDDHLWYTQRGNQHQAGLIDRSRTPGEGTFHRWWERCTTAAGVEYVPRKVDPKTREVLAPGRGNPHVTRHTFALNWLRGRVGKTGSEEAGKPGRIETLSKAMGHRSIQTTIDLYGHLDVSDVAADLALIEGD